MKRVPGSQRLPWLDLVLLSCLTLLIFVLNDIWIQQDTRPPHWDMGRHLWNSLLYLDLLHPKTFYHLWTNYYYYPPFRYWVTLPFYLLFGKGIRVAVDSNIVFIAILAFSMYGIGVKVWNRTTGLLAAIFILCSPMYVTQFKEYQLDAQQGAMAALAFYLFLRAEGFRDKRWSQWFGLSFGLGMLTKWTFVFCVGLPVVVNIFENLRATDPGRKERIRNIWQALLIALGISLLWYANHPRMLLNDLMPWVHSGQTSGYFDLYAFFFYPQILEVYQLYLIPTLFFLVGLGVSFAHRHVFYANKQVLLFVLGNYSMTFVKLDSRYSMPVLVGVAILAVFWITELKNVTICRALIALVMVYSCFSFWIISFGSAALPEDISFQGVKVFAQKGYLIGKPVHEDWHQEDIYRLISGYPLEERELAYDGPGTYSFNSWGFYYYSKLYDIPYKNNMEEKPFFIALRSDLPPKSPVGYKSVQTYLLPDKTTLGIFKR